MSIIEIKQKANNIYLNNRSTIITHFFFVGYISLLAQYLQKGFFSFFVSIFLCGISHGYVRVSMKVVNENKPKINIEDSLVGLGEFTRVFPTYFTRKLIMILTLTICFLPTLLAFKNQIYDTSWIENIGNHLIQTELFIPDIKLYFPFFYKLSIIVNIILISILFILLTILFSFMPYIIEEDDYSWLEAIRKSMLMIKGQLKPILFMYLLYLPRFVIYWVLSGIIVYMLSDINEIMMLICLVISLFAYIEIVKGRFEISKYLLYKEIMKCRGEDNDE